MSKRYFLSDPIADSGQTVVKLGDQEGHHLIHVMRAQVNDEVILFDGSGVEFLARLQKLEKRAALLQIIERREICRESKVRVSVGVALPKGERQQWLCEKLVELGCAELTPLQTRRGVAEPGDAAITRLQRSVVEASKQCGRNRLMRISSPVSLETFLSARGEPRLFLSASGELLETASSFGLESSYRVAVGPEGGWSDDEVAAARNAGWRIVALGSRILRVETAAIAIVARLCCD
jgi:16S rRNA (uracil1498-N3)-methyltransferase